MAGYNDEWTLDVPRAWMTEFNGFSMDTGGSVMKIVYRHKKDWEELKNSDKGRLRFMSFSRGDRAKALDVLKENCHVTGNSNGDAAVMFTTGVGSFQFSKEINEKFNAKIENITEFDAFVKSFTYLVSKLPMEELIHPECVEQELKIRAFIEDMMGSFSEESMEGMSSAGFTVSPLKSLFDREYGVPETGVANPDDLFPCVLAMMGSGFAFMQVNKDGSFQVSEGLVRGGRTVMALSSLMFGAKTYDELTELASRGNPNNVHYTNVDIVKETVCTGGEEAGGGLYNNAAELKEEAYTYILGKAAGKDRDDFSREDMAAALLQMTATDICQVLEMVHQRTPFKRVFWCGSFVKAEVVRQYITLEWRRRTAFSAMMGGRCEWVTTQFLKHGPYLGALGCVINSVDQFLKPPSEVEAERKAAAAKDEEVDSTNL